MIDKEVFSSVKVKKKKIVRNGNMCEVQCPVYTGLPVKNETKED